MLVELLALILVASLIVFFDSFQFLFDSQGCITLERRFTAAKDRDRSDR